VFRFFFLHSFVAVNDPITLLLHAHPQSLNGEHIPHDAPLFKVASATSPFSEHQMYTVAPPTGILVCLFHPRFDVAPKARHFKPTPIPPIRGRKFLSPSLSRRFFFSSRSLLPVGTSTFLLTSCCFFFCCIVGSSFRQSTYHRQLEDRI